MQDAYAIQSHNIERRVTAGGVVRGRKVGLTSRPMTRYKVGYFVGRLSSTSINRELSQVLTNVAPEDLDFTEIPIGNLPLYSQDYDPNYPPEATAIKDAIRRSDAVLSSPRSTTARLPAP